jgi:hypothetical protein
MFTTLSFHDEAIAEIGESQFGNTDEIARSSRSMTVFEGLRAFTGFFRAFPWIPDPVKDRSGMTNF